MDFDYTTHPHNVDFILVNPNNDDNNDTTSDTVTQPIKPEPEPEELQRGIIYVTQPTLV